MKFQGGRESTESYLLTASFVATSLVSTQANMATKALPRSTLIPSLGVDDF
jgi:hypothetical protein